ncbi:MAG: DNA primase [Gammaproteobacteria bacterium]|nr:DNA primase [Gammaproteobacteria bacterium]
MAKRIAQSFKDTLLSRIDIIDVINSRVPLKKAGKDYQACCPFHNEKTPSFTVAQQKQFFYCFGCGAKGNAIGFVMDYEHLSFVDALEKLAEENGLEVQYEQFDEKKAQKRKDLYDVLDDTASLYHKNLFSTVGQAAREYLAERHLDKEIADFFSLGYSLKGSNLQNHFGSSTTPEDLEKAGLVARGDSGLYDQFRDRLMFPIRDQRGRVVGFGARALGDAMPKYLNSKETEVFSKRYVLYGLYETLQTTRNIEHLIVVEGYMDVIALLQSGISGAVAALGTAFTPEHLHLAQKYTKKIFVCFDGDKAGVKAARRSMDTILPAMDIALDVRMVFLPDGEDPDTLVRKIGKDAFTQLLEKGTRFSEFVFQVLIGDSDLGFVEGRGEVASRAKELFDSLPDSEYKTLLYQELTERVGMDVYQLSRSMDNNHATKQKNTYTYKKTVARSKFGYKGNVESRLIRLLIDYPDFAHYVEHVDMLLGDSDDADLLRIMVMLANTTQQRGGRGRWFVESLDAQLCTRINTIHENEKLVEKVDNHETIEGRKERLKIEFIEGFNTLFQRLNRKIH